MLKIQKSRAMTRFAEARYQAGHPGKSGFISPSRVGTPKPFPFSIVEQSVINTYPNYKKFLPAYVRQYSDEIYDFRSLPYKAYYDKHGKQHVNSWWQQQLRAISLYQTSIQKAKDDWKRSDSRPKYYGRNYSSKYSKRNYNFKSKHFCRRICKFKYRSSRQGQNCQCRAPYRFTKSKYRNTRFRKFRRY